MIGIHDHRNIGQGLTKLGQSRRNTAAAVTIGAAVSAYEALCRDVRDGLQSSPKSLPPKWFYDSVGSDLFNQITRLPEYYPTRAEAEILRAHAAEVASVTGADTLIELGSGTWEKPQFCWMHCNTAVHCAGSCRSTSTPAYCRRPRRPYSVSILTSKLPLSAAIFGAPLPEIPGGGRRLFVFLGSTIGNLNRGPRAEFLAALAAVLRPGDSLLLGTDLVKDVGRLVRAYDDAAGVTAQFNRNVLVINRELDADFDVDAFRHVASWNSEEERMEMWLRAERAQRVRIGALDLTVEFAAGEQLLTEVSCKFRAEAVAAELAQAGLRRTRWWTDDAGDFRVVALGRVSGSLAQAWRAARPAVAGLHLDSAACSRQSFAVLDAAARHARHEAEVGGYVAAEAAKPVLDAGRAAVDFRGRSGVHYGSLHALDLLLSSWPPGGRALACLPGEYGPNLALMAAHGFARRMLPTDGEGRVAVDEAAISLAADPPDLVHLTAVASHRGVVQPLQQMGQLCWELGLPLVVDAAQALGQVDCAVGVDAVYASSRKWMLAHGASVFLPCARP